MGQNKGATILLSSFRGEGGAMSHVVIGCVNRRTCVFLCISCLFIFVGRCCSLGFLEGLSLTLIYQVHVL